MMAVRRARPSDALHIAAVHVAAWRSAYAGILPEDYLSGLSVPRAAAGYERMIRTGQGVLVAVPSNLPELGGGSKVVGFATAGPARGEPLGDGEISLLYVLDDWREQGLGRRLMRAAALHLAAHGCRSAYLWVLRDNPSRWFYERLGGRQVAQGGIRFAGQDLMQTAFQWDPIERLMAASPGVH